MTRVKIGAETDGGRPCRSWTTRRPVERGERRCRCSRTPGDERRGRIMDKARVPCDLVEQKRTAGREVSAAVEELSGCELDGTATTSGGSRTEEQKAASRGSAKRHA